jgi:hypothetical protein
MANAVDHPCFLSTEDFMTRSIYLASSWRNPRQPEVIRALRGDGHAVYDFRNPYPGQQGFAWREIHPDWTNWTAAQFLDALHHPIARKGFGCDWNAMVATDTCVLLLPCGRSAHLEAGYFVGAGKDLFILLEGDNEPELMYTMAGLPNVCIELGELRRKLLHGSFSGGTMAPVPQGDGADVELPGHVPADSPR